MNATSAHGTITSAVASLITQAPIETPTTRDVEQAVFSRHWDCPKCDGEMIARDGITVGWNTYWNHTCDKCGHRASAPATYPTTIYKDKAK